MKFGISMITINLLIGVFSDAPTMFTLTGTLAGLAVVLLHDA